MKIVKLMKNIKFSIEVHSRLVFLKNYEKLQIFMKIMKKLMSENTENIKFSNGMHYRALIFIEKLQFLEKISNFPVKAYPFSDIY